MSDAKELNNLPLQAGTYNVIVENVRTITPLFLNFDGTQWEDLEKFKKEMCDTPDQKIYYFEPQPAKEFNLEEERKKFKKK